MTKNLEIIAKCIDLFDLSIPLFEKLKFSVDFIFLEIKPEYIAIVEFDQFEENKISVIYEKGNSFFISHNSNMYHKILISGEMNYEDDFYYFPIKDVFFIYGILVVKPKNQLNVEQTKFLSIYSRFLSLFFKKEKLEQSIKEKLKNFSEITEKHETKPYYSYPKFIINAKQFILKLFSVTERVKIIKIFFLYLAYEFKVEKAIFFIKNKQFTPLYGYDKKELNFISLEDAFKNYNKISFNKLNFSRKIKTIEPFKLSTFQNPFCTLSMKEILKNFEFNKISLFPVFLKNNFIGLVATDEIKNIESYFRISLVCEILAGALNYAKKINSLRTMYYKLKFSDHTSLLELLGEISHEIKNPVMTIGGFANRLIKNFKNLDEEKFEKYLKIIADESQRLEKLLNEILIFSKANKVPLNTLNLIDVLKDCITLIEEVLKEKNIKLVFEYNVNPKIMGNKTLLKQVFLNILNNSIEAIEENGKIFISVTKREKFCEVKIEDTGGGISDEILNRIFEPFFTTKDFGTGLGLTVTFKIMQIHGGNIKVENSRNGAVFKLLFPCRR